MNSILTEEMHPLDRFLCVRLLPSVWCPGCGIGTVVRALIDAVTEKQIEHEKIRLISGAGCTASVGDYLDFRSERNMGRYLLDQAADIKITEPDSTVVVFTSNADLLISGARDLARAIKRGMRMLVIHINDILYILTGSGLMANSPYVRQSFDGRFELPFNVAAAAMDYGACYVARWTPLHAGWLKYSIVEALSRTGVSVIEVVSPCVIYKGDNGQIGDVAEKIRLYDVRAGFRTTGENGGLDIRDPGRIVLGKFLDQDDT
jgi:2-oxoglutarate ferredoxin oxidoreductase subunit beta